MSEDKIYFAGAIGLFVMGILTGEYAVFSMGLLTLILIKMKGGKN